MIKRFCDMCENPVESNLVLDRQVSKSYAGHLVVTNLTICTAGDYCAECLLKVILRETILVNTDSEGE